ncbi:response regulator [Uliginosibacterium sp. H3]|uniref:histidine kinase n=1 Tax=Uliginosibacterium silvisoli TaxID=3114758 RepID=A0ABU6K7U1_9RHOO|nr:response regulator [Uliginosibacterium sp. H3]
MSTQTTHNATGKPQTFRQQVTQATFLVVDDFEPMRKITAGQLRQLGAERILEAANGAEALKLIRNGQVSVVLSDWNMPVMSGLDLLRALRADPALHALPFMMITVETERERVQEVIHSGVSEVLIKPYTAGNFAERLKRAMTRSYPALPTARLPATAPEQLADEQAELGVATPPTILVVDDTPDNLRLLAHIFKEEYRVKIAHNGEKALAICHSDTPPDLVLLDVMMPDMDGFEVAEKLRAHPASEHIPIIFVTALNDETSRLKGMTLGAVDFVSKPINPETLQLRVGNFMRYIALHRQLQSDYDTMLEVARLKGDVEQVIRHDLRAPLAGVIGLTQDLVAHSNLREDQNDQLRMIEEAVLQALNMINRSSELYKIETGRFQLRPQSVAVIEIARRLAEINQKTFATKTLGIHVVNADNVPEEQLTISGEPMFCYSVLENLLKNACEAAPERTPISITLRADTALSIVIENQGTVPTAMRGRFFEKFASSGKPGGTGLGTYSARMLTEAQGGQIAMETDDATNSTRVTVTLPLNTAT